MKLIDVVDCSRDVGATRARKEKIQRVAALLRPLRGDEVQIAVAFLSGHLRQGRIGIGRAVIEKVAQDAPQEVATLSVQEVDQACAEIQSTKGAGSTAARAGILGRLFARATRDEQDFLVRLLYGELRHGALEAIIAEAVAEAAQVPARAVRRALMLSGDLQAVAQSALTEGEAGLARFSIQLFRPVQPMLAQSAEDISEALERLESGALEFKLDGARIQVHKAGAEVRVFTRQLNDVTIAVPEVVEAVGALPCRELILDGEVLALRPDGRPHPFQTTMRRFGRKLDVDELRESLPLTPFFFDCLYAEGDAVMDEPGEQRFAVLSSALAPELVIPRTVTGDPTEAEAFLAQAMDQGHEGIMAKSLETSYEAGRRGRNWFKIKPAFTLDLVVLAAEWGSGRRQGFLSNLHLAARDPATGGFVMIGKTFKGLTDAMLRWQTQRFQQLETSRDQYAVHVRPETVVEVAFNEIQTSPHYASGMALRFARVKRYRPDKNAAQADTIDTVRALHQRTRESV